MANFEIGGELAVEISWIARGPKKKPGHYVHHKINIEDK